MTKTEYLYGVKPSHFDGMTFYEALEERTRLAKKHIFDEVRNGPNRAKRVREITKAIKWCENLLKGKEKS